jgi:hypothetical protein
MQNRLPCDLFPDGEEFGNALDGQHELGPAVEQGSETVNERKCRRDDEKPSDNFLAGILQQQSASDAEREAGDGDDCRRLFGFPYDQFPHVASFATAACKSFSKPDAPSRFLR